MSLGIGALFDEAFFTGGAATSSDVPGLAPIGIAGHKYMMEPSLYERQTIARFRNPYDQSKEPGEHSLSTQGPWLRSTSAWGLGAGQDFWDHPDNVHERFRTSKGLDFWTDQNRVQLLHDTRNIRASANTNLKVLAVGAYFYIADGTDVRWTLDPTGASPSFTSAAINIAEGAQTVNDFTTDGAVVYAAVGVNGIHKSTLGATVSTHLSALAATHIQYANGRLLAAATNVLSEVDAAGVATTLKTHASSSFTWTTIAAAPNGIYAGGNLGDRSEIYFIGLKADHTLDSPIFAGSLPDGETINTMFFYNGVMVIGSSIGIRLATITNADGIAYSTAIKIPGGVTALEPQFEFVWFSWTNFDGTSTGLGRVSLAAFTDTLLPAYSSDLMATTQGAVRSATTFGAKRYFTVSGVGFFAEYANLVASGVLYQGWIGFGTGERKVALSVDLRHEPMPAGGSVAVTVTQEEGTTTVVGSSSLALSLSPENPLSIGSVTSETFELVLTLTRATDATMGPKLRRWTFRSLITPIRYDEIRVALILTEKVFVPDGGDGHELELDPFEEWSYLQSLVQSGAPVTYQEGLSAYTVYVESVGQPQYEKRNWTPDRAFLEGIVMVDMVTL